MEESSLNVQRLLDLIKYRGVIECTEDVLNELCLSFVSTIPFSTVNLGGKKKMLRLENIYEDLVVKRQGGFCFELNGLFHWLLSQLGFQVELLPAYEVSKVGVLGRTCVHVTLKITLDNGDHRLADVCRGGQCFVLPLKMSLLGQQQHQPCGIFRIIKFSNTLYGVEKMKQKELSLKGTVIKINKDEEWIHLYGFSLVPRTLKDFQASCTYAQYEDPFLTNNSIVLLHKRMSRIYIWGTSYVEKEYIDQMTVKVTVNRQCDQEDCHKILKKQFNLNLDPSFQLSRSAVEHSAF